MQRLHVVFFGHFALDLEYVEKQDCRYHNYFKIQYYLNWLMNAGLNTSLHKSGLISMFLWGEGLEAALFISSIICTFFPSSAHSKTECPKLHDHLEATYSFTCIGSINSHN